MLKTESIDDMASQKMKVEVWTDIMCPYCYIGKLHYEQALRKFDHTDELKVEWKAFQLNPDLPDKGNGYPVTDYLKETAGFSEETIRRSFAHIKQLAKDAGVSSNLTNAIAANTRDAHRLIKLAAEKGLDSTVLSMLSKAYFEEAKDYSDHELLVTIGKDAGLEEDEIRNMLNSDQYVYEIKQDIQEAANLGFDTVPTFLFDRSQAIIGSEPVDLFVKAMNKAYHNWKTGTSGDDTVTQKGLSCSADGTCEIS